MKKTEKVIHISILEESEKEINAMWKKYLGKY